MSPKRRSPLTTEYALLGFLRRRPMHGYEIYQELSEQTGLSLVWRVKQSRLYSLLARLEKEGYLTTTLEPQPPRPPRKVFELSEAGCRAFLEWVETPVAHGRRLRLDFLAKLYFARPEGQATTRRLIERQRAAAEQWLEEQQALAESVRESSPYDWLVHQFRLGQIQAIIDWLDLCRDVSL